MTKLRDTLQADDAFLSYVCYHSRTDRALFSREHAERLVRMAGALELLPQLEHRDFIAIHADVADDLLIKARQLLAP